MAGKEFRKLSWISSMGKDVLNNGPLCSATYLLTVCVFLSRKKNASCVWIREKNPRQTKPTITWAYRRKVTSQERYSGGSSNQANCPSTGLLDVIPPLPANLFNKAPTVRGGGKQSKDGREKNNQWMRRIPGKLPQVGTAEKISGGRRERERDTSDEEKLTGRHGSRGQMKNKMKRQEKWEKK